MATHEDVERSEYATALRRVVLENADEIFAECKKRDPNSSGTLSTEKFCDVVSLVLGLPPNDATLLFTGAMLSSHTVAYASWLLQLQGEKSMSPNRGPPEAEAELEGSIDSLVLSQDGRREEGFERKEDAEEDQLDEDIFESFSDVEDELFQSFTAEELVAATAAMVNSPLAEKRLVPTTPSVLVENNAAPSLRSIEKEKYGRIESSNASRNSDRRGKRSGLNRASPRSQQASYERLWTKASADKTFLKMLDQLEATLRLEKEGLASHAQTSRAVGQLVECAQRNLFESLVEAQTQVEALSIDRTVLRQNMSKKTIELERKSEDLEELKVQWNKAHSTLTSLQHSGNELLDAAAERQAALGEMKRAHAETLKRTSNISEGITGAIGHIRTLASECSDNQTKMKSDIRSHAILQLVAWSRGLKKLDMSQALHKWKLNTARKGTIAVRNRLHARLEKSQKMDTLHKNKFEDALKKNKRLQGFHQLASVENSFRTKVTGRALDKWKDCTGHSLRAVRQKLKTTVRDLLGKQNQITKERDHLSRRLQEMVKDHAEELTNHISDATEAKLSTQTLEKKLELQLLETERWKKSLENFREGSEKNFKERNLEFSNIKAEYEDLAAENGSLKARVVAAEEQALILKKALDHEHHSNNNKMELLMRKTAKQVEAARARAIDGSQSTDKTLSKDNRSEVLRAFDRASQAAQEAKHVAETAHSKRELEAVREETSQLLATQELLREEMNILRQEKLEVDHLETEERDLIRAEMMKMRTMLETSERERKKLQVAAMGMKREVAEARALAEMKILETDEHRRNEVKNAKLIQQQQRVLLRLKTRTKHFHLTTGDGGGIRFSEQAMAMYLRIFLKSFLIRQKINAMAIWRSFTRHSMTKIQHTEAAKSGARRVLTRWKNRIFLQAFRTWTRFVGMDIQNQAALQAGTTTARRVLRRWEAKNKLRAWRTWRNFVYDSMYTDYNRRSGEKSARRVLLRMAQRQLLQGWRTWCNFARVTTQDIENKARAKRIAGRVMVRISHRQLVEGWYTWCVFVKGERQKEDELSRARTIAKRVVVRINHRQLMEGWTAWTIFVRWKNDKQFSVKIAKRVVARLLNNKLHYAFSTWHRKAIVATIYLTSSRKNEERMSSLEQQHEMGMTNLKRQHEGVRRRLLSRLIIRIWTIRHETYRKSKKTSAFMIWKRQYKQQRESNLLSSISDTQRSISASLTLRGMVRYTRERMRRAFKKWYDASEAINAKKKKLLRWLYRIDNVQLSIGFQTWRLWNSTIKERLSNTAMGLKVVGGLLARRDARGISSAFRKWLVFSLLISQKKMSFEHAQKFVVNKVKEYLKRRQTHALRVWRSKVKQMIRLEGKRRRACQLFDVKLTKINFIKKTKSFRYWSNIAKGMKIQEIRIQSATKFIVRTVRTYVKSRLQEAWLKWISKNRALLEHHTKLENAFRFVVVQLQRNYMNKIKSAFEKWSNRAQMMGIKNLEMKSAVKFVVMNIHRYVKKRVAQTFRRWVDVARQIGAEAIRNREAVRFIVAQVRKYINAKTIKAFNHWQQFCMSKTLEEQRRANNDAALAISREHHENMVAARFIAMVVSKEKAAMQSAWGVWRKVVYDQKVMEVQKSMERERETLHRSHSENMEKVTQAHEQTLQNVQAAAARASVIKTLARIEGDNLRVMMQVGLDAFKMRVHKYNLRRTRAGVILLKSSSKWKLKTMSERFSFWRGHIAREKIAIQTGRYVMNCIYRNWRLKLSAAMSTWRTNAQLKGHKHNMQVVYAKNMFTKQLLRIARSQRRAFDKWISFAMKSELAQRSNAEKKAVEDRLNKEREQLQDRASQNLKAMEQKLISEQEKSSKEVAAMKEKYDGAKGDTSRLEARYVQETARSKLLQAHLTLSAVIRTWRKKHLVRCFTRWWFTIKTDTVKEHHRTVTGRLTLVANQMKEDHENQFREAHKKQLGIHVLRSMQNYRTQKLIKGMGKWKELVFTDRKDEQDRRQGFKTVARTLKMMDNHRLHRAFSTWLHFNKMWESHFFAVKIRDTKLSRALSKFKIRTRSMFLFHGWRYWTKFVYHDKIQKHRKSSAAHRMFYAVRQLSVRRKRSAWARWDDYATKKKYTNLVISKLMAPATRFRQYSMLSAFKKWKDVTIVFLNIHVKYKWAFAGVHFSGKLNNLHRALNKVKLSRGFRKWISHTHIMHHMVLEKQFELQANIAQAKVTSAVKISHFKQQTAGALAVFKAATRVFHRQRRKSFAKWKAAVGIANSQRSRLQRVLRTFIRNRIRLGLMQWKRFSKNIARRSSAKLAVARILSKSARGLCQHAWVVWRHYCLQVDSASSMLIFSQSVAREKFMTRLSELFRKVYHKRLRQKFLHWSHYILRQRQIDFGFRAVYRSLDRNFYRRVLSAFYKWHIISQKDKYSGMISNVQSHYSKKLRDNVNQNYSGWKKMKDQRTKALFCLRWQRQLYTENKLRWAKQEEANYGYLSKMETTMAAMKSEHDEEAEWSENMTNEIKQLQQRVLTVKEKQKRETEGINLQRKKDATWTIFKTVLSSMQRRQYRAFGVWREKVIGERHRGLSQRLLKKAKKSDIAVKRIKALMQKAQHDHIETEKLLKNLKNRAETMKEQTAATATKRRKKTKNRRSAPSSRNKTITLEELQASAAPGSMIRLHRSGSIDIRVPVSQQSSNAPITTPKNHVSRRIRNLVSAPKNLHAGGGGGERFRLSTVSSRNRSISPARKREDDQGALPAWSPPGNNPEGTHWAGNQTSVIAPTEGAQKVEPVRLPQAGFDGALSMVQAPDYLSLHMSDYK